LTYLLETKTNNIKQLKSAKKKLEQKNIDLEFQLEQNMKEIEYLKAQNILTLLNSSKKENKENNNEYYEKQINDSNLTIKKMGEMIQELEKQIEELQKELENNNYIETKNNKNNNDNLNELVDLIKKKDKEIKQYQLEIRILNEEKSRLYEDNSKMYANLDRFQKYITDLIDENKKLSKKINKYTNSENDSQLKEIKSLNQSEVNEDDISKNTFKEFKTQLMKYKPNEINKENINDENINADNIRYNGLSDSEINENIRDIKININKNSKDIKHLKIKDESNKENESQNLNYVDLNYEYDGKENEELSD
jgi:hypothetical protein